MKNRFTSDKFPQLLITFLHIFFSYVGKTMQIKLSIKSKYCKNNKLFYSKIPRKFKVILAYTEMSID